MKKLTSLIVVSCVLGLVSLVGCGGGAGYETAPVSGTVTLDGKPAEGVTIHFLGEGMTAVATTDASGKYQLERGAVVGDNKVYFSKLVGGMALDPAAGMDATQLEAMAAAQGGAAGKDVPKQALPAAYCDPAQPKFTFAVPSGGTTTADFEIPSK